MALSLDSTGWRTGTPRCGGPGSGCRFRTSDSTEFSAAHVTVCLGRCFLDQVPRVGGIARQPQRRGIHPLQGWQGVTLKLVGMLPELRVTPVTTKYRDRRSPHEVCEIDIVVG